MHCVRASIGSAVRFLNQPIIKENIKNVVSGITFTFGLVKIYDLCVFLKTRKFCVKNALRPSWQAIAKKVVAMMAEISIVLSTFVSRPGVFIISTLVGRVFSADKLKRIFGPNTTFARNSWHPRHFVSIAAVILALPALTLSLANGCIWAYKKIARFTENEEEKGATVIIKSNWLLWFNAVTNRPAIHFGNRIGRVISKC